MNNHLQLPTISDEKLTKILQKVMPVVERNGQWYAVVGLDPRNTAFTWAQGKNLDMKHPLDLVPRGRPYITFHGFGYYGIFKPSAAEVIAQSLMHELEYADAFSTTLQTDNWGEYCSDPIRAALINHGLHVGLTTVYNCRNRLAKLKGSIPPHEFRD